ncbi:unnamed protein product [marine sediment metagenome]|uniref:Cardiolipin synthase N-terminal domain-containing protein n=1 Tax=marine sediment metagenome TaxID=412755 RepID=X1MSH6_9ZZZZ
MKDEKYKDYTWVWLVVGGAIPVIYGLSYFITSFLWGKEL